MKSIPCPTSELGPEGGYEITFIRKRSVPVEEIGTKNRQTGARVLIFPARMPEIEGRQVFYLFSVRQVVEVLSHVDVQPVPFGPKYALGIAEWRGRVLPVLSLENWLGINRNNVPMPLRTIVVRSIATGHGDKFHELYAIFKVGAAAHHLELPLACEPAALPDWVPNASYLSGVYEMQERLLLIVDIGKILNA